MFKAWKKALVFMLITVVIALVTFGCGTSSSSPLSTPSSGPSASSTTSVSTAAPTAAATTQPAEVKLTVAWWGSQVRNQKTTDALNEYSKENPGVTFDGQFYDWANYWDKLATAAAGQSLPDIVQMDYSYLGQYANGNLLVDLTPYTSNGQMDVSSVDKNILNSGTVDGKLLAIPAGINTPALIYNKTLLDGADITVKDNMTTDDFINICRQVYEKTKYKTNIGYQAGSQVIEYMLRAQSKVLFEKGKLGVDNASQLEPYYNLLETGRKEGWLIDGSVFTQITVGTLDQDPLVNGSSPSTRSWCSFQYTNSLVTFVKDAKDTTLGITTYPSANPQLSDYLKPSMFFSVTSNSKVPDAAVKVVNYLTNSVDCNNILLGERGIPASSKVADAILPQLDSSTQAVSAFIKNVVTPNSTTINPPAADGSSEVSKLLQDLDEQMYYGKITAKDAGQKLFDQGNQIMAGKK